LYQFHDIAAGTGGGAAVLKLDTVLLRPPVVPALVRPQPRDLRARLQQLQLVTDLGRNIGSLEWFRGFALCAGLCYAAYSLAPPLEPFVAPSPAPLSDVQWDQARALSIAPLAYGADTGRRLAATDSVETLTDTPERPSIDLLAPLVADQGFARSLRRAGIGAEDADRVGALVGGVVPLSDIVTGTAANVTLGRRSNRNSNRPLDALAFRARFDLKLEVKRVDGALVLNRIPIPVDNTPLRFQGRAGSSLYRAIRAAGATPSAAEAYIRALATQVDVGTIGANDRFDLIQKHRRAATGETETGDLLYAGLQRSSGKRIQLMQWTVDGRTQWFDGGNGVSRSNGMFQRPVPGTVSSNFGMRRHPILGYSRMHKGMDFRAGYGTPILAATDGRIERAGWTGGYGQQVRIRHGGCYSTSYSHMSRMAVRSGQTVRRGQVIGYVGSTGLSTGPHLHYEVYCNGRPINPASAKYTSQAQLNAGDLAAYRRQLNNLLATRISVGAIAEAPAAKPTRG
jgi:murein DD-endopeptidase MepM/ murein hydrolase activator NlpD